MLHFQYSYHKHGMPERAMGLYLHVLSSLVRQADPAIGAEPQVHRCRHDVIRPNIHWKCLFQTVAALASVVRRVRLSTSRLPLCDDKAVPNQLARCAKSETPRCPQRASERPSHNAPVFSPCLSLLCIGAAASPCAFSLRVHTPRSS